MKVLISVDMEGVSGVVDRNHTSPEGNDYQRARQLMTGEANAAVEGAFAAGASDVLLVDAHGGNGYRNILIESLDPRCWLLTGADRPRGQMQGLDSSFTAAMMVGQHVRNDNFGTLSHTISGRVVVGLKINDYPVGEPGYNAFQSGQMGVPMVLIAGDDRTCEEVQELIPNIETAVVKRAVTRYSAICMPHERAQATIREAAERALKRVDAISPWRLDPPYRAELKFLHSGMTEIALRTPGVEPVDPLTIAYESEDADAVYRMIRTLLRGMPIT